MTDLIIFDEKKLPDAFGLYNTGSICYFNSLLQLLASCTSLQEVQFHNCNELLKCISEYIDMIKNNNVNPNISFVILECLHKINPNFGNGQESASEAFTLLLDSINSIKLISMFISRYRCVIKCKECNNISEEKKDYSVIINLFHIKDELKEENILKYKDLLNDYKCEECKKTGNAEREYRLTMTSEILTFCFNIYHDKKTHKFPEYLTFPGKGTNLTYKLIGQIEHSGSLNGGHYWSRVLRKDGVYICNDNNFNKSNFTPTNTTYLIMYHIIN
jgi:ubiquitin C-terminal hydrolase